jgi:hypothetical protein
VSISGSVWICRLEHEWVGFDVLESPVHETTIAAIVLLGAVEAVAQRRT